MAHIPAYLIGVETRLPESVAMDFDAEMMKQNIEYASKRESGRLGAPRIWVLPEGTLDAERRRKSRLGVADGQVKDRWLVDYEQLMRWTRSGDAR